MKRLIKMKNKMNVLKISLALAAAMVVTGCAALSQKEASEAYGSGQIVYFEVNRPHYQDGDKDGLIVCRELGGDYCNPEFRNNLAGHSGNIKVSMTKILKIFVLAPKQVQVKKYDIIKAKFVDDKNAKTPIAHFIEVADPADCQWDGTGVICKSGWDYHKDLPIAMR